MKTLLKRFCLSAFLLPLALAAGAPKTPLLVTLDYDDLLVIRQELKAGKPEFKAAHERLLDDATKLLDIVPPSVMDKTRTPPSGDKHDFFAIGNYSWPNPDTADGVPYLRRDGQKNPEAVGGAYDKGRYDLNSSRIKILALAWFHSGDERYAAKAAALLRTWFLDPATRMNPNLNFAASQPGVHDGVYFGIIEGVQLIELVDHVKLLAGSAAWTAADDAGLRKWFSDFSTWLLESDFGKKELVAHNNHGTWCAAQIAAFSLYAGDPGRVAPMIEQGKARIREQVAPDGSLPAELRRSRSFMYSQYALRAFGTLARCGELAGADLWHYRTPDGRGLELAFTFIAPYLAGSKAWTWPSAEKAPDYAPRLQLLRWPARVYRTPALLAAAQALDPLRNPALGESLSAADRENRGIWLQGPLPR